MIREVCSCGAEFESDLPEQIALVKNWRRTHKHQAPAEKSDPSHSSASSTTEVALGFRIPDSRYDDE